MKNEDKKTGFSRWLYGQAEWFKESFLDFKEKVLNEPAVRLMAVFGLIVFILSLAVWIIEKRALQDSASADNWISSFGRALYWMFISGTTTGYGDIIPHTSVGRGLTVAIILSSMILTSILTAIIASWFVERRLLEGKGMEKINWRGHVVICGWNVNAYAVLEGVYRDTRDNAQIVLINNLEEEQISEILYKFKRQGLRFVRGDFVHENVLQRSNVAFARAVVIMADGSITGGYSGADERTVLCSLAVKSMNTSVRVCAELVDEVNIPHLKRAQVDHIVVLGDYEDFLLANAVTSPGVTVAVQELLNPAHGFLIQQAKIPSTFIDQDFGSLSRHFREKQGALVIGVVSEEDTGVALDDILSDDMSAIDLFIKRQFEGMEEDYFYKRRSMKVRLNPPDSYVIKRSDTALLIAEPEDARPAAGGGQTP